MELKDYILLTLVLLVGLLLTLIILPFAYTEYLKEKRRMGSSFPFQGFWDWFERRTVIE